MAVTSTLDKLLAKKVARLVQMQKQLYEELAEFEQAYSLDSSTFYRQFEEGKLGDSVDYVEWSSTVEMVDNLAEQLSLLQNPDQ